MRNFLLYLKDILEAIEAIKRFTEGIDFAAFKNDDMTKLRGYILN